jgi:hypothetical protein
MANLIKKLEKAEQQRLLEALGKTKPGTPEYSELQKQLGAFAIMEEKRSSGKVKPIDIFKFGGTLVSTGLLITADQWAPMVGQKLKMSEFIQKLVK